MAITEPSSRYSSTEIQVPRSTLGVLDWIALTLLIIGGINWGLVGLFNVDLVAAIFGQMTMLSRVVYGLVGLSAVYGIVLAIRLGSAPR